MWSPARWMVAVFSAGRDTAPSLQAVDVPLDGVALLVGLSIESRGGLPPRLPRRSRGPAGPRDGGSPPRLRRWSQIGEMSRPARSEPAVSGPVRLGILRMGNSRLAHELLQSRMFLSGSRSPSAGSTCAGRPASDAADSTRLTAAAPKRTHRQRSPTTHHGAVSPPPTSYRRGCPPPAEITQRNKALLALQGARLGKTPDVPGTRNA